MSSGEDAALTYAALGDSTGVGVGARDGRGYVSRTFERLRADSPRWELVNLCVSGAAVRDVTAAQLRAALRARPRLATLFIGSNDVWQGTSPALFASAFDRLTSSLVQVARRLIVGTVPNLAHAPAANFARSWFGITPARLEQNALALNAQIRQIAARHRVDVVDMFAVGLADRPHYFSADGFHPSSEGYEAWAEQLLACIRARPLS